MRLVSKPGRISNIAASKISTPFRAGTVGVSPRSNCRFNSIQQRTPVRRAREAPSKPPMSTLDTINQVWHKQSIRVSSATGINTSGNAVCQNRKVTLLKGLKHMSEDSTATGKCEQAGARATAYRLDTGGLTPTALALYVKIVVKLG